MGSCQRGGSRDTSNSFLIGTSVLAEGLFQGCFLQKCYCREQQQQPHRNLCACRGVCFGSFLLGFHWYQQQQQGFFSFRVSSRVFLARVAPVAAAAAPWGHLYLLRDCSWVLLVRVLPSAAAAAAAPWGPPVGATTVPARRLGMWKKTKGLPATPVSPTSAAPAAMVQMRYAHSF